jgi:trimeric autotransporter adhesin
MPEIISHCKNLRLRVGGFILLLLSAFSSIAQTADENVGIGTTKPDISAILDLTSNSKGLLIPRMTLVQRGNIKSPANGLMVYQTDFFSGFYFFDGLNWKGLYARSSEGAAITTETTNENSWSLNGNSKLNSDIHFIGTLDTTSLLFKVNNYRSGLIDYRFGNTYFGYRAGYRSHGFNSVAIGAYALHDANLGLNNIAIGYQSLPSNKTGSDNVALGANTLYNNITGSQNISIGTEAGLNSLGDGNVFIGHKAGIDEIGDNKLYIDNNFSSIPLLFGDFETGRIGINTKEPESALSIDSKIPNVSGLEFKQLTNHSPAERPTQKVLSVDDYGRVILVRDSIGYGTGFPPTIQPSYWALKGSSIENSNDGDVILSNIRFKTLRPLSATIKSNLKVLTIDDNGKIVLTKDSVGTATPNHWDLNVNSLSNNNSGKLVLHGPIQLNDIKASNKAFRPYGKVLTVDDSGNLILVRDSVGTSIPTGNSSPWNSIGNNIANSNPGIVFINHGLILSDLNGDNTTTLTAQKFLTVDNTGKVFLANSTINPVATSSQWAANGNNLSNSNAGGVYVKNGFWVKNSIHVESGILEINSAIENKSGLQFLQLKASTPAEKPYGKVLSVDDNGNVILVKDSVGTGGTVINGTPSSWNVSENNISNNNSGSVNINNNLVLSKLSSNNTPTTTTQKVLSVDADGKVILVNTPSGGDPVAVPELWKTNTTGGIFNNSTHGILVSGDEEGKSGLQLTKLKASTTAFNGYGKVLSVDDNGNVILVNDAVGSSGGGTGTGNGWTLTDGRLHNANNGKVVIGTGINSFPDGFQLFVKGGILTERVRVAVANSDRWADYVFKKGYQLMPLKEVEKYIKHHQHLPNVPSAEEMAKNGLDVTETSAKLMEKLEELTLYMIDANKKIEALEEKVKNLEKAQK